MSASIIPDDETAGFTPLFEFGDTRPSDSGPERTYTVGELMDHAQGSDFFRNTVEDEKRQAYLEGFGDGERQTTENMSNALETQMESWSRLLSSMQATFQHATAELLQVVEERVVNISTQIARKLLEGELSVSADSIGTRLHSALLEYAKEPSIIVRVNSADYVFLNKLIQQGKDGEVSLDDKPSLPPVSALIEDKAVEAGGFVVETSLARFDHTMSSMLEKIEADLMDLYEPDED